jgi:hypothetical protein
VAQIMAQATGEMGDPMDVEQIARHIRAYLGDHPNASDSLDGVARWWIGAGPFTARADAVQQALDQLVSGGFVSRRVLADGTVLYAGAKRPTQAS